MSNFNSNRKGSGTREWSEYSHNIQKGCLNNCVYCYAKSEALHKYKTIKDDAQWLIPEMYDNKINKSWSKMNGVIMFPTAHDIDETNIESVVKTLKNMLASGNEVLIVSKPRVSCIDTLTKELEEYKSKILFRFTIGSTNNKMLNLFEPRASTFEERLESLKLAKKRGFKTSISSEPLLGGLEDFDAIYDAISDYVTDTIWIGKMNKIDKRVKINSPELKRGVEYVIRNQTDDRIWEIFDAYENNSKISWKDSIKQVVNI